MDLAEYERINPHVDINGLKFFTPNRHCAWRVQTLFTKEPDTTEWIRGMKPDAIFFDVGANIGQYALLAAQRGLKVHAFEPESQNFALLNRNIALNGYENITAWPFAFSNRAEISQLHISQLIAGGSCHAFGESLDFRGESRQFPFKQGSISVTMDDFAHQFGLPDYIKIDVDGFEHLVCAGAANCLNFAQSVLVEINTHYPAHVELVQQLTDVWGFKTDPEQIRLARRTSGTFEGVGNIIFFRGDSWR